MKQGERLRESTAKQDRDEAIKEMKRSHKEAINDIKRDQIMDAALKVIARDGFLNARLEDIAEEAGFSKAYIYRYFPDKEALYLSIILRQQRAAFAVFEGIVEHELPFMEKLREFTNLFYENFFSGNDFFPTVASALITQSLPSMMFSSMAKHEELSNSVKVFPQKAFGMIRQVFAKARQDGIIAPPVSDEIMTMLMISTILSLVMKSAQDGQGLVSRAEFDKTIESMFAFIKPWLR